MATFRFYSEHSPLYGALDGFSSKITAIWRADLDSYGPADATNIVGRDIDVCIIQNQD